MRFGGGTHQTEDPTLRRLLSAAAIAALSIGLLVPAADAATTPITSYNYVPSDWDAGTFNCSTGAQAAYTPTHVVGPATPPVGLGSLKVTSVSGSARDLAFGFANTDIPLTTVNAFSGDLYVPSVGGLTPQVSIAAADATPTSAPTKLYFLRYAPTAPADSWVSFDATAATLTWQSFDLATGTYSNVGSGTLAAFNAQYPNLEFGWFNVGPFISDPSQCVPGVYYLDDVRYAAGGVDNTVDFEAPTPTAFTNGSHPSSVLTGTAVTLSATLKTNGVALANQSVGLYLKGTGSKSYKLAKTLVTNSSGAVSYKVAPSSTTSYQWRFASSSANQYAPANASSFTITTRQKVTISSKPTSVSYRGTATIKGRVTPHKSGVTVRLVRIVSGKRIVVASARTTTGGYFTIKAPMTVRGTYPYVVTAVAYTGEAQGQSPSFKITTR